jgi:hypothetical protein
MQDEEPDKKNYLQSIISKLKLEEVISKVETFFNSLDTPSQERITKLTNKKDSDYSPEFAAKFKELMDSDKNFKILEVSNADSRLKSEGTYGTGKVIYNAKEDAYDILYTVGTGARIMPEGGFSSEYATLFEEVYHAVDIIQGCMDYNAPTTMDEARAWQFAAIAPGTSMTNTSSENGKEYTDFTVAHTIKSNPIEDVAKWFKEGKKEWVDDKGVGHQMINSSQKDPVGRSKGLYHYLPLK